MRIRTRTDAIGVIHMGAAKTGSSTLQEFSSTNRGRLRDAACSTRQPWTKQHGLLAEACTTRRAN